MPCERRTVAVVAPAEHPTLPLLRAELEALGLKVRASLPGEPVADSDYRVVLGEGRIEVWVYDQQSQRAIMREVFAQVDATPLETLTAVLHAVELLRLQLNAPAAEPASPPPVSASEPEATPTSSQPGWIVSGGPEILYSAGGTTLGAGAELDVARRWAWRGVRVFGRATLRPNRQTAPEGVAEARSGVLGAQGVLLADGGESPWLANLGAGLAIVGTSLAATAEEGYTAGSDRVITLSPIVDLRAGVRLGHGFGVVSTLAVLAPLRSTRMIVAGREVARYGAFLAAAGVGLQLELP